MIPGDGEGDGVAEQVFEAQPSLDPTTTCPAYSETGRCRHGFKCRFLGAHLKATGDNFSGELSLTVDDEKATHTAVSAVELNFVDSDVRKRLRTRKVTPFYSSRGLNSADTTRSGPAPFIHVCKVSEARIGHLPERDPAIARREGRGNPGDGGGSNRDMWCRLRRFDARNASSEFRHVSS